MKNRNDLSQVLHDIINNDNVYFEPPESKKMRYPAIVYGLDNIPSKFADNKPYKKNHKYKVTYITLNPDSTVIDALADICTFERSYISDGLYHYVYHITY